MACPMSPIRPPGTAASMPAASVSSATLISLRSSARGWPTVKLTVPSACQPSTIAPQSTLSRSPSRSRYDVGSPCSMVPFTLVQMTPG